MCQQYGSEDSLTSAASVRVGSQKKKNPPPTILPPAVQACQIFCGLPAPAYFRRCLTSAASVRVGSMKDAHQCAAGRTSSGSESAL